MDDPLPYGIVPNPDTLTNLMQQVVAQGIIDALNQTGFIGERKAWKVSHDKRKFREPFFDRSAGARSAFGA
jgi:hypothetical protein